MVDQKMTSFRFVLGTNTGGVNGVADPKRLHDTAPSTMSTAAGIQLAIAPTLFDHACQAGPPMNSALAAAKYSNPGKYGRFEPQYVQPVMNAENGPKARLL